MAGNLKLNAQSGGTVTLTASDTANNYFIALPSSNGIATISDSVTGSLQLPVGNTAQRPATTANGMMRFNTDINAIEHYNGSGWIGISGYQISYTLVAGGGAGGSTRGGGGGGGGFYSTSNVFVQSGTTYTVTIGAGGTAPPNNSTAGGNGGNTSITTVSTTLMSVTGGGGGGSYGAVAKSGGSGGGGATNAGTAGYTPGSATPIYYSNTTSAMFNVVQGYRGGYGATGSSPYQMGGGGGGASGVGANGAADGSSGAGAQGVVIVLGTLASNTYCSGGGPGISQPAPAQWQGGTNAGKGGSDDAANQTAGAANRGAGGGASGSVGQGMPGGSGIAVISYWGSQRGTGGTVTSANGFTHHLFTTTGTFVA